MSSLLEHLKDILVSVLTGAHKDKRIDAVVQITSIDNQDSSNHHLLI